MMSLNFSHSEDLRDLAEVASEYFESHREDQRAGVELGWYGIGVPEELGGAGGSLEDLAVIVEAAGAAGAASLIGFTAGVVTQLVLGLDSIATAELLAELCSGELLTMVPASDPRSVAEAVTATGDTISGQFLAFGEGSSGLVVVPFSGGSNGVALFDIATPGVEITEVSAMDQTRPLREVKLSGTELGAAVTVIEGASAIEQMTALAALTTALDSAGAAKTALERTLAFAGERWQFGRPIASFQAYKHRCADNYIKLRLAQSVSFRASRHGGLPTAYSAAMEATRDATAVCGDAVQLHGAMGFSWETGIHAFLKRARANELFWSPSVRTLGAPELV
jgi:alkylation response protein AidB-like acyl-CoA dehydrogenase